MSTQSWVVSAFCTRVGLQWERPSCRDECCYKGDSLTSSLPALTRRHSNICCCQLGCLVFLVGPGGMHTAMSYDVDTFLYRCMTDFCELATLTSTSRHNSATILGDGTSGLGTHVLGEGFVLGRPWCRCATAQMRDSIRVLAAASTALPGEAGDELQRKELHDVVHRVLAKARWATILRRRE